MQPEGVQEPATPASVTEADAYHILLFLDPSNATSARATSKGDPVGATARGSPLWTAFASRCFGVSADRLLKGTSGKECLDSSFKAFVQWHMKGWGAVLSGLKQWTEEHVPGIAKTFRPGLGSSDEVQTKLRKVLAETGQEEFLGKLLTNPHVLGLWRVVDGQDPGFTDQRLYQQFGLKVPEDAGKPSRWAGMFGGYCCYDKHISVALLPLEWAIRWTAALRTTGIHFERNSQMIFAMNSFIGSVPKILLVDVVDASVAVWSGDDTLESAAPKSKTLGGFLQWFQEYVRRLNDGVYAPGELHPESGPSTLGIRLFPMHGPAFSIAITRGVECTGSSIYMSGGSQGWTYSISFRLVGTAAERGFQTCQLYKRKWMIQEDGMPAREVEGEGVVGLFPILTDGGWILNRESDPHGQYSMQQGVVSGAFRYQSCSGRFSGETAQGSFAGTLEFHPGTKRNPTGQPFYVNLERFRLDMPEFQF